MRYTFVKQHDITDCAAACLAMVCLHYKKETTITKLRDRMGTDIKGTNLIGLSKCADELGFVSQAVKVDREGLLSEYTRPCIANIAAYAHRGCVDGAHHGGDFVQDESDLVRDHRALRVNGNETK
jgi:ABC-type bacteriocin/lantibiotic exporter with double-glycine peptidase domain